MSPELKGRVLIMSISIYHAKDEYFRASNKKMCEFRVLEVMISQVGCFREIWMSPISIPIWNTP